MKIQHIIGLAGVCLVSAACMQQQQAAADLARLEQMEQKISVRRSGICCAPDESFESPSEVMRMKKEARKRLQDIREWEEATEQHCVSLGEPRAANASYIQRYQVDQDGENLLMLAAFVGDIPTIQRVLERYTVGINDTSGPFEVHGEPRRFSALHYAALGQEKEAYDWLIAQGIDQSLKDSSGRTARQLWKAIAKHHRAAQSLPTEDAHAF